MLRLIALERRLAGVMTLDELGAAVLPDLQSLAGASGSTVYAFDARGAVLTFGGNLEEAMRGYTPDLIPDDPIQQWNFSRITPDLFLSTGDGFDWPRMARSRAYADFYRARGIGTMLGVLPSGLRFGAPNMFGVLLVTPSLRQPIHESGRAKLAYLELPLRSAARRIQRFRDLQQQRQVAYQLLNRSGECLVVWDADGQVVWVSIEAQCSLGAAVQHSELHAAARLAQRQLRRSDTPPRDAC